MKTINLLIFPIDIDASARFAKQASGLGINIIGASSERKNHSFPYAEYIEHLPYVTSSCFDSALEGLIKKHKITHIYTPHEGIWEKLSDLTQTQPQRFSYKICGPHPYTAQWLDFLPSYEWAANFLATDISTHITNQRTSAALADHQYAGLHYHFTRIPGQTNEDKLSALASIFQLLPQGDIVEIGSLYGKSAYALGWLALKHAIGNLICVDPWDMHLVEHQGTSAEILNKQSQSINLKKIFKGFLVATSPLENVGYIKDISEKACKLYQNAAKHGVLDISNDSSINITGDISLLHIDGNHRYDLVCQDIECWQSYIQPGGWILVDDYVWAFGNGPKLAGDELLMKNAFDIAFCSSDTLFLRRKA